MRVRGRPRSRRQTDGDLIATGEKRAGVTGTANNCAIQSAPPRHVGKKFARTLLYTFRAYTPAREMPADLSGHPKRTVLYGLRRRDSVRAVVILSRDPSGNSIKHNCYNTFIV